MSHQNQKTYRIRVSINQDNHQPFPQDKTSIKDFLGDELNTFYTGWGMSTDEPIQDFFFNNVPEDIAFNIAEIARANISHFECDIKEL